MRKRPMCLACLGFMLVLVLLRIAGVPLGTPFSDPKYENKAQQGRKVWIAGTIETYEKKSSNNGYVLRGEGSKGKFYLLAKRGDLPVGAAVRVYGTVKKPESPRNPGMFDEKTYYEGKGCAFYVISEREEVVNAGRWNLGEALRLERERCCAVLKEMMPEEEAGVLSAMLLGERSELTEETYLAYQQSGLLHLISVSGMHLMLLGMALRRLLMALHLPKTPASLAAAAGMVLYGMFTGSGTATVRAVVMFAVRMGAVAVGRTYDSLSALSLAAILMLAENPSYLEQSGFWLSFGAVTAISGVYPVLAGEKAERKRRGEKTGLEKLAAKGKEAAMVYLSLQLVMIPLQAWYFYEIPLFAFLPNLFAGAVMTAVLLPGAAGLLAGLASVKAGSVVLLPARFLLTLLRQMTAAVAQIPGNVWICGQPEKWQMAGYGIILTGLLVILYVRKRKREMNPDGAKRKGAQARRRERMLFGITMFFACVLLFYRPRETFSITALDVGQGDALVVESGRFLMLNDGGSSSASAIGEKRILPYLKQRGIAALDAVVVTHPDADHTNGILELLELIGEQKTALRIRHLFLPVWMKGSEKENPFILAAQKAGIMVEYLKKGDEIRAGELTVSVLHPGAGEDYTGEENAGSVVLQLSCGACRALLTGDLEGSGEEEVLGAAERCQILKVAHHGSRNSTSEAFLNRIQPQISLISCAWPGRYGHPHRELLERLRACKSHIYGTPVDGAVTVQLKRDRGRFLMLNDGGSSSASAIGEKRILPYLKQRGIAALDAVVVTHPDADHTNGILELLELIGEQKTALRIRHLFLPVWMKGSEKENPFILAAQKAGIMVEYLKKGDEIRAGELTVSVLHPGAGEDYTGEENAGSVVLQLSCGACRALLTGDLEGSGEEEVLGAAERCQILKVAHHGSRNSTSEAFLNRIQPQISLISCAWPGRYGHPHRELLERLRACKSHIYGTPVDGAVTVQLKRDRLAVHGYRSDVEFPVS